ncbi:beta-glycosidase [Bacteroides sp. 51]|uniref:beta-glycosidase n=1 Tax=Bacteroides sp. 51 TaxID=2302938 RepID=UPI0013D5A4ED|nr:beta-glycosidase [Bacteroides sp. 51]NDV83159.1 beta-glycosidase [Bacteroides sp. 51]
MKKVTISLLLLASVIALSAQPAMRIDLSGYWKLFVDQQQGFPVGQFAIIPYDDAIVLPATLDEARKGEPLTSFETTRLSRKYAFAGRAWYQKEINIPASWAGAPVVLHLERTKPTHVWVDGRYIGNSLVIASSQTYNLPTDLSPGKHLLTILVDNGDGCGLPEVICSSHQWSDDTQTNWNGILGQMYLQALPTVHIQRIQAYPDVVRRMVTLKAHIKNCSDSDVHAMLRINSYLFNSTGADVHAPAPKDIEITALAGEHEYTVEYPLGADARLWSEYAPNLYRLNLTLSAAGTPSDSKEITIGLREFRAEGRTLTINGTPTFLRGKHDGCVFPLTGYAPMNRADWMRYFDILQSYGFNHVRFHSWCPPAAAFEAADLKGFYLQPELPIWGGVDEEMDGPVNAFLIREGRGVMDDFGNHPSFVCFSTGNELWGSVDGMKGITRSLRWYDPRHLYALGSNFNLGWLGEQGTEDIIVACRVGGQNDEAYEPHVRSSFSFADAIDGGLLNATYPNTTMNFDAGVAKTRKPVIAHETGQFQIYPNAGELKKYTGVLAPHNLERFCTLTHDKYGIDKVERFFRASGALSLLCYKADMEMSLRTSTLAGFQMLDIQDFPGQGTALVGLLDAFMDSKGITTPEEFSQFNAPIVPLWESESYTWNNNEMLRGTVKLFNYAERPLQHIAIDWALTDPATGSHLRTGSLMQNEISRGLAEIGEVEIPLSDIKEARALRLTLALRGTRYMNSYNLWVYPVASVKKPASVEVFTQANDELLRALAKGKKVLLMPAADAYPQQTVGGLFTNDYWNYSMFKSISENNKKPVSPGTLGYLIEDEHPLFAGFPTSSHSDWQWWAVAKNARPLIMDQLASETGMIVEAIDNMERNHKLGVIFECWVGKGKLFVCMADLLKGSEYAACKQLLQSIYRYMDSRVFAPQYSLSPDELSALFNASAAGLVIEGVINVSY